MGLVFDVVVGVFRCVWFCTGFVFIHGLGARNLLSENPGSGFGVLNCKQ